MGGLRIRLDHFAFTVGLAALAGLLAWCPWAGAGRAQAPQEAPAPLDGDAPKAPRLLDRVYFASASADLSPQSLHTLSATAATLRDNRGLRLRIEGHADHRGGRQANRLLSERRAEAVLGYLVDSGIERARIEAKAMGSDHPLEQGDEPETLAKNRRVDLLASIASAPASPPDP